LIAATGTAASNNQILKLTTASYGQCRAADSGKAVDAV
jgi:hypothetical protein